MTAAVDRTAPTAPRKGGRRSRRKLSFSRISFFAVFLGLPLAVYLMFVVSPFIQAFYYSMTDWSGFTPVMNFIALDNYTRLFQDSTFMTSLWNNIILVVFLPVITIILSLILATLVTVGGRSKGQISGLKHSDFYRVVSFFPYVIPAIAIGLMWRQVFAPNGLVNGILTGIGLDQFVSFAWLGEVVTAMPVSMFVAAIKGIPAEIYEAARLDGAGRFRTAVSITIPMIRDNVQTAYIYMGILALDGFVYMAALNPGGGPAFSTIVMPQVLLDTAFTQGQFGRASAMGVIMAIVTLAFAGLVFLLSRLTGGTKGAEHS